MMFGRAGLVGRVSPVKSTSQVDLAEPVCGWTRGCPEGIWDSRDGRIEGKKLS